MSMHSFCMMTIRSLYGFQRVHSVCSIYISFINCVSKQANWSQVKLFFLSLIFSLSWLRCRRLNQAVRNQTAQLNGAGWNATCLQLLAIYYFSFLFISTLATWVFVKVPAACDELSFDTFTHNLQGCLQYFTAAKMTGFPPLPNQLLKIWFRVYFNGITEVTKEHLLQLRHFG